MGPLQIPQNGPILGSLDGTSDTRYRLSEDILVFCVRANLGQLCTPKWGSKYDLFRVLQLTHQIWVIKGEMCRFTWITGTVDHGYR